MASFSVFKFDIWEGGHRVPFIARWPGKIPAGTKSNELLCNVDLLATLAAIVKYPLKNNEATDSYNMLPALVGSPQNPIRKYLILSSESKQHLAIRKGKWMYIPAQGGGGSTQKEIGSIGLGGPAAFLFTKQVNSDIKNGKIKDNAPPAQLYDLDSYLAQKINLYNVRPDKVNELKALLEVFLESNQSGICGKKTKRKSI